MELFEMNITHIVNFAPEIRISESNMIAFSKSVLGDLC